MLARVALARGWPTAFAAPGVACVAVGALICAALRAPRRDAAADDDGARASVNEYGSVASDDADADRRKALGAAPRPPPSARAILAVPGLVPFSLCLFLNKLVAYALMLWLPLFLTTLGHDALSAGTISACFDVGGLLGGLACGYASDRWRARATVSAASLALGAPALLAYARAAAARARGETALLVAVGALVGGPYSLITSAVAADLGQHPSLDARALSTVTGIVDGVGSCGTAAQGVVVGYLVTYHGWWATFRLLALALGASAALIARLAAAELRTLRRRGGH